MSKGLQDPQLPNTINQNTPIWIRCFIAHQCEMKDLGSSTAQQLRSALKMYYREEHGCSSDGWDQETAKGNPCDEQDLLTYLDSFKKQCACTKDVKKSLPMLYWRMEVLHKFFLDNPSHFQSELEAKQLWCLFTLCFICWFRIDEALNMKMKDIQVGLETKEGQQSFAAVQVSFRKTNQDNPNLINRYELHPQSDEPAANAFEALQEYIELLYPDKEWRPDDLLFPKLKKNEAKWGTAYTGAAINKMLLSICTAAGLLTPETKGTFTTHCFRRGGAQHRFMYCSLPWPLDAIKWWGGWAQGEQLGAIVRYLLEEYNNLEYCYGDMLSPERRDRNVASRVQQSTIQPSSQVIIDRVKLEVEKIQEVLHNIRGL
jgi:hypothetical protein